MRPAYRGGVSLPAPLAAIGDQRFVSLTTFRKNGAPVATPVWIAPDGEALVVTTPADSGKVKRLRHDPRVEMLPCSRRGRVPDGAKAVTGVADLVSPDARQVDALRKKYGREYRLVTALERLLRRGPRDRVIVRVTAACPNRVPEHRAPTSVRAGGRLTTAGGKAGGRRTARSTFVRGLGPRR